MRKHQLLIAVITFGLIWIAVVRAEDQPIEQQLVDAMNKVLVSIQGSAPTMPRASLPKAPSRRLPRQ